MNKIKVLGNLFDWDNHTYANGRVYSIDGIAPAIASSNFGHEKWILELRKVDRMYARNTIARAEQSRAEQPSCRIIGQMDNTMDNTFESANRVYDTDGIAPTVNTCGGGGFGEKKSNGGTQWYQQDRVYKMGDVAMCHPANIPGGSYNYLEVSEMDKIEKIVAMRGRNPDNPTSREVGLPTEQRLEMNENDTSNCITSVTKDNLVMETSAIKMVRTEDGKALRKAYENGEIHHGYNEYREPTLREDGLSNTVSTVQKDSIVCETKECDAEIPIKQATKDGYIPCKVGGGCSMGVSLALKQEEEECKEMEKYVLRLLHKIKSYIELKYVNAICLVV